MSKTSKGGLFAFSIYRKVEMPPEPKYSDVYYFCEENNIECGWDFSTRKGIVWTEIYSDGQLVMQVDNGCSRQQFVKLVKMMYEDFDAEEYNDGFDNDVWIAIDDEDQFKEFVEKHKELFL